MYSTKNSEILCRTEAKSARQVRRSDKFRHDWNVGALIIPADIFNEQY